MVTAVVSGKLEVVQLRIEPSLLEKPDADMLQDLVVAAVNEGIRAAQRMLSEEDGEADRWPRHQAPRDGLSLWPRRPP